MTITSLFWLLLASAAEDPELIHWVDQPNLKAGETVTVKIWAVNKEMENVDVEFPKYLLMKLPAKQSEKPGMPAMFQFKALKTGKARLLFLVRLKGGSNKVWPLEEEVEIGKMAHIFDSKTVSVMLGALIAFFTTLLGQWSAQWWQRRQADRQSLLWLKSSLVGALKVAAEKAKAWADVELASWSELYFANAHGAYLKRKHKQQADAIETALIAQLSACRSYMRRKDEGTSKALADGLEDLAKKLEELKG